MISLRVGTVLSYGLLIGILAWLTMASIASIDQVNTSLKLVNEVNGVKQRHAINFRGSVHDRSILIRDVILAPDAADRAESIRGIETLRAFYDASAGPMDALFEDAIPDSAEERDILSRIKAVQARTVPLVDRAIALSLAGESEAAETLLMAEIRPAFADWLAVINEMIDHQEGLNRDIGTDVAARVENFAGQSYGLLALGAGLAVLLLGLTLWSLHPLSRLERALAQVAQGNYDVTIGRGGVTEVRKLRASATAMLESLRAGREAETLVALAEELRGVLHRVRAGDLTARLETEVHDGTALDLRDGTNALIESMATGLEATMSFLSQLAAGDLTARMQGASTGAFKAVERDANKAAQSLEALLFTLVEGSAAQEARTADLTDKMGRLSHEAQTSAATLEETVAALEELAGSVKASSENATEADRFLQTARQTSDDSTHVVREAVEAMDKILSASEEISQIIKLIDDIAFQTNLLALNSGVEAARAGDAGRGFAVVAQEVRALAQRSADAAAEIKRLIDASARHVETGVHLVDKAGKSILSVNGAIGEIAGQVNQIATATHEQARNIALLNASANDLDRSTQTNAETLAQAVEELARVAGTATETAQRAGRFRVGSEREAEPQNRRAA